MIAQDLRQVHNQILIIIVLKDHKIKCKYEHDKKKCDTCGIKCKDLEYFLEYKSVIDDTIQIFMLQ